MSECSYVNKFFLMQPNFILPTSSTLSQCTPTGVPLIPFSVYTVGPELYVNHFLPDQGLFFSSPIVWDLIWATGMKMMIGGGVWILKRTSVILWVAFLIWGSLILFRLSGNRRMLSFSKENRTASASVGSSGKLGSLIFPDSLTQISIFPV